MTHVPNDWPEQSSEIPDAGAENVLQAFIDYFNARDLEGVTELLSEEVSSDFFDASTSEDMLEGMSDFLLRHPTVVLTRGELGQEPVVVAWAADLEDEEYHSLGYFTFTFTDGEDGASIDHISYVDRPDDTGELLAEQPEPDEIAEWEDWNDWDR
ncbi:MAG: hypothetical protein M3N51_01500 [Actinomycetota bacterium]|nr:hypothetical protein [Actinomycetota bacterium]